MQYITKLDRNKLGEYGKMLITEEVILTDERLYEHILLFHEDEYKQLRPYIKNIIEKSQYYDNTINFNDVKKIQYFLAFNDMEFTVYYKEGTTKVIYDDSLDNLREYIENNGYNEGKLFIFIGIIVIFICIGIYGIKKEISKQIDFIDKDNY